MWWSPSSSGFACRGPPMLDRAADRPCSSATASVVALRAAWRDLRTPERAVLGAFALSIAVGFTWGLPSSSTWAVDSISPRSCGLGAIVETYWPGHFHTYPALHTGLLTLLSLPWIALAAARVGLGREGLGAELIKPLYMTGIEV